MVLALALIAGLIALASVRVTLSAFSTSAVSEDNQVAAGTVYLEDNDSDAALLDLSSAFPGDSDSACVRVTFTGSLDSEVRLFADVSGALAPYLTLTVQRGADPSPSFPSCAGFSPDASNYIGAGAGVIYSGSLGAYPSNYSAGLVDPTAGAPATWSTNDSHSYKLSVELQNNPAAQAATADARFIWEARNK